MSGIRKGPWSRNTSGAEPFSLRNRLEISLGALTLLSVVVGGVLHYFLIDRPAADAIDVNKQLAQKSLDTSELNRRLLESALEENRLKVAELSERIKNTQVSTEVMQLTLDRMSSPLTRESERLSLREQQRETALKVDDALQSYKPNVSIPIPKLEQKGLEVRLLYSFKNLGTRSVIIGPARVHLSRTWVSSPTATSDSFVEGKDFTIGEPCHPMLQQPGNQGACVLTFNFRPTVTLPPKIYRFVQFDLNGVLDPQSETYRWLRQLNYGDTLIQQKIGNLHTDAGWMNF
jgi:hypothetical protein